MRVLCGVAAVLIAAATPQVAHAETVDCAVAKCVALTFDDGPAPHTDRLLRVLTDSDARATFFLIGDKVAADPAGAARSPRRSHRWHG